MKNMVAYIRTDGIYNDSRATKEIKSLLKAGYRITIIGWDRSGSAEENCKKIFSEFKDSVYYYFYRQNVNHIGVKNITKLMQWFSFVRRVLHLQRHALYAVHACNLDASICCWRYCKKRGIKIVYDIYDYYTDSHNIPGFLKSIIERSEIQCINNANLTIICTEERKEQINKSKPHKLIVIHNSPDVEMINSQIVYDYFYCGVLGGGRLIEEILDNYSLYSELKVCFAGYGDYKDKISLLCQQYDSFSYLGELIYSETLLEESKSRCLSAIYNPNKRNHRLCAPNKFYEALALGKPVIVCRGTGIDQIVEQYNIGTVIDYDVNQFYSAVQYYCQHEEECKEIGIRARLLYDTKYSWSKMEGILLNAYSDL